MSEKLTGARRRGQLALPTDWWCFANDSGIIELENIVHKLSSAKEHRLHNINEKEIREAQLLIARQALGFYGVKMASGDNHFDNGYQLDFEYGGHHVDTTWYNNASLTVRTWDADLDGRTRFDVWDKYRTELDKWNDPRAGHAKGAKPKHQEDTLYTLDPTLLQLCEDNAFREFTLRTSHASHIQTRNALPAAIHLIGMPVMDSYPIVGPGKGDIEVIKTGIIMPQGKKGDNAWSLNSNGVFVEMFRRTDLKNE